MPQNALPSVPSSSTSLHCTTAGTLIGAICTVSGIVARTAQPVSLAHVHNSTRLCESVPSGNESYVCKRDVLS